MTNILYALYTTNRTLASYVRNSWFYVLSISVFCVVLISIIAIDLFFTPSYDIDYHLTFLWITYIVIFFDLISIILRIQSRSFIEPNHLSLFPLNKWKRFLFHIVIYLMDYKSFIYISVISCFLIFFIKNSQYLMAIYSMFLWLLLLIIVLAWTLAIYGIFGRYLDKIENKLPYIGLFFVAILLAVEQFGDDFFIKLPVISHTGNVLYGLWTGSLQLVWANLLLLLGSLVLPLLLLYGISKFNRSL